MELNYTEFISLVFSKKKLPCTYSLDTVDGERYYNLQAAEVMASSAFHCIINSVDDSTETTDFERNYKHLCNREIIIPGMTPDIQAEMLYYLEEMLNELKILNERFEQAANTGLSRQDILDE